MSIDAKTEITFEFGGEIIGPDGYRARFVMDDSLSSWWSITNWNWHYRHWRALAGNGRDLFGKVLWGKLWRRS